MSTSRSIWIVTDYFGEYEDAWDDVVRAFSDKDDAMECLEKRTRRQKKDTLEDYFFSDVREITLVEKEES